MTTGEILTTAKQIFIERGGAVGIAIDDKNRICATHACQLACNNLAISSGLNTNEANHAFNLLSEAAKELFADYIQPQRVPEDLVPAAQVNDKLGVKAVLDVYDLAIKKAQEDG